MVIGFIKKSNERIEVHKRNRNRNVDAAARGAKAFIG